MELDYLVEACAYAGAALAMGFGAIGSAVGEGQTAGEAASGMMRQPAVRGSLLRTMLIGQAVCETAGIFSLVVAVMLLFGGYPATWPKAAALLGAGLGMGLSALGTGVGSGMPSAAACKSVARNPDCQNSAMMNMLIAQALATGCAIFGFVVALLLITTNFTGPVLVQTVSALSAGICIGLGSIGPGIGIGIIGYDACEAIGNSTEGRSGVSNALLLGSAISQSKGVFALLIAIMLIFAR